MEVLRQLSDQVQKVLGGIEGRGDVSGEQLSGQPVLQVLETEGPSTINLMLARV
jgi:Cu/Ag efflux pump CusA